MPVMTQPSSPAPPSPRRPAAVWLPLLLLVLILAGFALTHGPAAPPATAPTPSATPSPAAATTAGRGPGAGAQTAGTALAGDTTPTPSPPAATPAGSPTPATGTPATAPSPVATASPFSPAANLAALAGARIPARDLYALTAQVRLRTGLPLSPTAAAPPPARQVGARAVFNVGNVSSGSYYTVTAVLRDVTAHAYWWVADGDDIDLAGLKQSAAHFEQKIYPGDVATFGDPPAAGPDGDPHLNVLNTPLDGVLGYFSAADMYPAAVNPYSNGRKMIYIGMPPGGAYEGVLAHEFQHMIHWHVHPNQAIWINEGMAELAMKINGYDAGGVESAFEADSGVQLNFWSTPVSTTLPHYGAAYLFMDYLYGRYGPDLIRAIMQAPGTDIDAIDQALAAQGHAEGFAQVVADWAVANWLGTAGSAPRYRYPQLRISMPARTAVPANAGPYTGTVPQQAADYLQIPAAASGATVTFEGDPTVPLTSGGPHGGQGFWWSNRGDVAAPRLTRAVDLRGVTQATLTFWAWYDVEDGYDYAYAEVSTDGGTTWQPLPATDTTAANPNGNNLGNGFTGRSGSGAAPTWVRERADLSPYAGQPILLRFEYVTDDGVNLQGFAVDDIRIPEIGFADDAEAPGANGWQAEGFVHTGALLPERFAVALITPGNPPAVQWLTLDSANRATIGLPAGQAATLMVMALAPGTVQPGHYTVTVRPAGQ